MVAQAGGCLCSGTRYEVTAEPVRVTICHCRFCQRATGTAYMIEPIFRLEDFRVTRGAPATYSLPSGGSGKRITVHFCAGCGTKIRLTFERFPEVCGLYAGTFDDPDWFPIRPDNSKVIFAGVARHDSHGHAGLPTYAEHATTNDGVPNEPSFHPEPCVIRPRA